MDKSSSKRRHESSKPTTKRPQPSHSSPERSSDLSSKSKKSKIDASATKKYASDPVRLHIAPLTAESAKAIVAVKHLSTASFHAIDTFPEKSYGFVTLPRAEAEALRKKYNGTVFRGVKMSVEEARPAKEAVLSPNEDGAGKVKKNSPPKTSKKEDGVLPGFELPEGRQVKRGWTKDITQKGAKGKSKPSAGTSECLFKTVLPPVIASEITKSESGEDKSNKRKKSRARVVKNQVVVKEFKNSTKFPAFLKMSSLPTDMAERSAEFVGGVGWVNDAGEVIEGAPTKRRKLSIHEEPSRESEKGQSSSSNEDDDSQEGSDDSSKEDDAALTKSTPPAVSSSGSASDTSESEDDSESNSDDEGSGDSKNAVLEKDDSRSDSLDEASSGSSESSSSESPSSEDSESGSESEAGPTEAKEPKSISTAEPAAKQPSSNFANLTTIFKPKLSLDTEATSQFKFFGGDLDESDEQEGAGSEAEDDQSSSNHFGNSVLYTPITPQAERYRSGAPTPDTAVAPRFKDFLPFPKDFEISIEREYFPTITAEEKSALRKPSTGVRLLFPHTYDDSLHAVSIWSSVKLPKILTTGELPEKQAASAQEASNAKSAEDTDMAEPEKPAEEPPVSRQPKFATKQKETFTSNEVEQLKTGSGSKIVGWAGKKKIFDDDDDFDMVDASVAAPPKAKMGAGSGVVGWAGKKKTFDDGDDDDFTATPLAGHQVKAKTGAGSGVTGWAGKKKTFDDDGDDDLGVAAVVGAPAQAKTGAGSGVTAWAGKKKTFDDDDDDDNQVEEITKPAAPKISIPAKKSKAQPQGGVDSESEKAQLPLAQMWEKVFYENRGDWNRQWKRKKREVAKAKRKKEKAKRGWTAVSS
ncbi:hypothetical protein TWF281_011870 [Arthrobotrys megalospora]